MFSWAGSRIDACPRTHLYLPHPYPCDSLTRNRPCLWQSKLDEACDAIRKSTVDQGGGSVRGVSCDVTSESGVLELFGQCEGLDLLVNCAGIAIGGPTAELSAEAFMGVLQVNVLGPFLCAREAFKRMASGGRIVNVGSISAQAPRPHSCPYTTSKFAIDGLTRSLALDGRPLGIAVGVVHPGNVRSAIMSPEEAARREQAEGFITADDVAACVLTMATLPLSANVLELTVMPTRQPLVGRG